MWSYIGLSALGIFVGAIGTLIGAGGGFILAPILMLMYPEEQPETIASISLCVVFFNALSGSIAYARQKRIDYRSGVLFAAAGVPGAVLGAFLAAWIPRGSFELILGSVLVIGACILILLPRGKAERDSAVTDKSERVAEQVAVNVGEIHVMPARRSALGAAISAGVGVLSSLLGIGGGIIHVPMLTHLLAYPVHVATATSHFVLVITAFAGTLTHIANGSLDHGYRRVAALAVGVLVGAPIGARLSMRLNGRMIIRGLAAALVLVGIRIIVAAKAAP